uniref:SUN domain-containing protein n=1 Tax=Callorhinchus milii TaxID=7868 RepID=A0A4W3I9R8_CALMI
RLSLKVATFSHSLSLSLSPQPDVHPGNCWAFKGSQGFVVIHLSAPIRPTAFTLEHIPKSVALLGSISSAPRDFAVYGLADESKEEGHLIGRYTYDQDSDPIQIFPVQVTSGLLLGQSDETQLNSGPKGLVLTSGVGGGVEGEVWGGGALKVEGEVQTGRCGGNYKYYKGFLANFKA